MRRSVPVAAALVAALVIQVGAADAGGFRRARRAATKMAPTRGIVREFENARIHGAIRTVGGSNGGRLVEVAYNGISRGIFKPAAGEGPGRVWLMGRVKVGTYYRRDVAAWRLSVAIGLGAVPPTVQRIFEGKVGSLQLWRDDARALSDFSPGPRDPQLDRAAAERMRAFDFILGNADRKPANMLVAVDESTGAARYEPVAIDHGSSLPLTGRFEFRWPLEWIQSHEGPVLAETRAFLRDIDPATVAESLSSAGIERKAVERALYRLERLKRDPDFLALGPAGGIKGARQMLRRMRWAAAMQPNQQLPRAARRELTRVAEAFYR